VIEYQREKLGWVVCIVHMSFVDVPLDKKNFENCEDPT
jgi:hypothetical protein